MELRRKWRYASQWQGSTQDMQDFVNTRSPLIRKFNRNGAWVSPLLLSERIVMVVIMSVFTTADSSTSPTLTGILASMSMLNFVIILCR